MQGASAGPGTREKPAVNVCGSTKVIRGANYSYTVVLTNISNVSYRSVKLSVIYAHPITRSSIPYSCVYSPIFRYAALWTLNDFKPGRTFRVGFTLPFKEHNDKKGSNFVIEASAHGAFAGRT